MVSSDLVLDVVNDANNINDVNQLLFINVNKHIIFLRFENIYVSL